MRNRFSGCRPGEYGLNSNGCPKMKRCESWSFERGLVSANRCKLALVLQCPSKSGGVENTEDVLNVQLICPRKGKMMGMMSMMMNPWGAWPSLLLG